MGHLGTQTDYGVRNRTDEAQRQKSQYAHVTGAQKKPKFVSIEDIKRSQAIKESKEAKQEAETMVTYNVQISHHSSDEEEIWEDLGQPDEMFNMNLGDETEGEKLEILDKD